MKTMRLFSLPFVLAIALAGCGPKENDTPEEETNAPAATDPATGESASTDPGPAETESTGEVTNVTAEKAMDLIKSTEGLVVLDVRTPAEFAEGHIAGAINVDFRGEAFEEEVAKLDPKKPYVLHCRSGSRSASALSQMEPMGFKKIYHLDTGFLGWQEAGLPVEK